MREEELILKPYEEKIAREKERFSCFFSLLKEYNEKFNLTSIEGEREIYYKHFLDSVLGEKFFPQNASVSEVGSGAGFPSIPLMLIREDLSFSLFESVKKKCAFLKAAIEKLSLNAKVFPLRAEEAARGEFREKFDVSCARAVANLNTLSEYCLPLIKVGGLFLAYKTDPLELEGAKRALSLLGGRGEEIGGPGHRRRGHRRHPGKRQLAAAGIYI